MAPRATVAIVLSISVTLTCFLLLSYFDGDGSANGPLVIVVPGGGLEADCTLPHHSLKRVERALELFRAEPDAFIIALSAGTTHKPNPTDKNGFPCFESSVALKYLVDLGVPASRIMEEKLSLDTIGNVRRNLRWA